MSATANIDELASHLATVGVAIRAVEAAPWIDEIELRLQFKLPVAYRNLVTRYSFPVLSFQTVELFANLGDHSETDLTVAPFCDPHLSQWLTSRKLFQVGRPSSGSYDPICVDASANSPALVQLDHEGILLGRAKVSRSTVASSIGAVLSERIDA